MEIIAIVLASLIPCQQSDESVDTLTLITAIGLLQDKNVISDLEISKEQHEGIIKLVRSNQHALYQARLKMRYFKNDQVNYAKAEEEAKKMTNETFKLLSANLLEHQLKRLLQRARQQVSISSSPTKVINSELFINKGKLTKSAKDKLNLLDNESNEKLLAARKKFEDEVKRIVESHRQKVKNSLKSNPNSYAEFFGEPNYRQIIRYVIEKFKEK